MNSRISKLVELTLSGEMCPKPTKTEYDPEDLLLPKAEMESKRICEYIENQTPLINQYCAFPGLLGFDGSCIGDAFSMAGHDAAQEFMNHYLDETDNITVMLAQHATGDYHKVLNKGIKGIIDEVDASIATHTDNEKREFLLALKRICFSIIRWAHKCSEAAIELAETLDVPEYKENLTRLSHALLNVPEKPSSSFYEAVLCMNICYSFNPDSFGTLDRYLEKFYDDDIKKQVLTREEAKIILQEFLLAPQAWNTPGQYSTRGGQSHFVVGGYTENGKDGFTEFSKLIVESLMELPTYIPEISFRWTPETSHEDFRYILDCERKDKYKRIAFTNDYKRIKGLTEICEIPFEKAINYTMVGCNELAFPGSICASTSKGNILRCIDTLFHKRPETIKSAQSFDEFYEIFEKELYQDLDIIYDYDDKYNLGRALTVNYASSIFFNGPIEKGKSLTQGGCDTAVSSIMLLGMVNLIDSLIVIKQFVYDEKTIKMDDLISAVNANWEGYADMRATIERKAEFFGNDTELSRKVTQRIYRSIYKYLKGKRTVFGYPALIGDHTGYNRYFKWFGLTTAATPDGRYSGEPIKFGLYQRNGRDRNGLTALLNSIATADPYGITCGATVTNITVEKTLMTDDNNFEKMINVFETFFRNGGVQFQLNYVSEEELINAKENPDKYKNLRVRVTGFSEYFVKLQEEVQNDIIERTAQK